jgi:hypothetical protein
VNDAVLVRLMDGELDAAERGRLERALQADPTVAQRLALLERRARRFSARLLELDGAMPPAPTPGVLPIRMTPRRRPAAAANPWLRAAAIAAVGLGVVLGAEPLRAWLASGWERLTGTPGAHAPAPALTDAPSAAGGAILSFHVASDRFTIDVASRQLAGSLIIERHAGNAVTAEILTAGARENLVVLPAALRIENSDRSTAEYRVTVPDRLRAVRVTLPGRQPVEFRPAAAAPSDRWVIDLSSP